MAITLTTAAKNAALDGIVDLIDGGTGSAGSVQILDNSNNELATLPLSNPAFGSADNGTVLANAVTSDNTVNAGTASLFKVFNKEGQEIFSGTVSGLNGGGDLVLSNANLVVGDSVRVSSFSMTI
jgi:hypothetical protein